MNTALRINSTHAAASPPKTAECYAFRDPTAPGLSSTLLPAPQSETDGEEEIIVIALAPRLERHIASGDVGSAAVVLEFVHQSVSILGAFGDPDLPLLKSGYSREDEIALRQTPVAI